MLQASVDLASYLSGYLSLGSLLDHLSGRYEILIYWPQGEFHHDLVLQVNDPAVPGSILIVSTDCNGGVKELICLAEIPDRWALWHHRCPDNPEFTGSLPPILDWVKTPLWFDPCQLLTSDAPSELQPEWRSRQQGGGWILVDQALLP